MDHKPSSVDRRKLLSSLGVTVGGVGLASAGLVAGPQLVKAASEPPKGNIPTTPYKTGHMTFFTSPAAVLGEPYTPPPDMVDGVPNPYDPEHYLWVHAAVPEHVIGVPGVPEVGS